MLKYIPRGYTSRTYFSLTCKFQNTFLLQDFFTSFFILLCLFPCRSPNHLFLRKKKKTTKNQPNKSKPTNQTFFVQLACHISKERNVTISPVFCTFKIQAKSSTFQLSNFHLAKYSSVPILT